MGLLLILSSLYFIRWVEAGVSCQSSSGSTVRNLTDQVTVFDFGAPTMFVTTYSQNFDPYSLVDSHKRTAILQEYLMVGYKHKQENGKRSRHPTEGFRMILVDDVKSVVSNKVYEPDLAHQNLEKELYWNYFNSTGVTPSLTIVNTTRKQSYTFYTNGNSSDPDTISFHAKIKRKDTQQEPQVPLDAIFEIPANSQVLRRSSTIIEYQSFGLWRWRLSDTTQSWDMILSKTDALTSSSKELSRIDNPCAKDLFLVESRRKLKGSSEEKVYISSPLIQNHLGENWFYDMTTAGNPWYPEVPQKIVLTNDHLIVLTKISLWISESLNVSTDDVAETQFLDKKLLTFTKVNPCANIGDDALCLMYNSSHKIEHKLFYNPVCYLFQYPNYDDTLIFTARGVMPDQGFSVLYAPKPYTKWNLLFSNVFYYKLPVMKHKPSGEQFDVVDIVGIFFNHHMRHFDITLKLEHLKDFIGVARFVRFVLPAPCASVDGYGHVVWNDNLIKKKELNGTMGNGFLDFVFPVDVEDMTKVVVNVDVHDVMFLGNQLWIAEAGGPFVYAALAGISSLKSTATADPIPFCSGILNVEIDDCSFNHPDRTYVCMSKDRRILLAGRIGSGYAPMIIEVDQIPDLVEAQKVNIWPRKYFCDVTQTKAIFVAGFSGRIMMWYMHEPKTLEDSQKQILPAGSATSCPPEETNLCKIIDKQICTVNSFGESEFRLVSIDPVKLSSRKRNTDGALVPFLIDANAALLFEAIIGESTGFHRYIYFSEVNMGQKIYCNNYDLIFKDMSDPYLKHNCELFIRHIKPVDEYLEGFRRCLYVSVLKSIPLHPVPVDIVVLVQEKSNRALIKVDDNLWSTPWHFTDDHIGQTLYLPGNFSILLDNFPKSGDTSIMSGFTTMYFQYERRLVYSAFYSYFMDLSTRQFRNLRKHSKRTAEEGEKNRLRQIDNRNTAAAEAEKDAYTRTEERWKKSPFSKDSNGKLIKLYEDATRTFTVKPRTDVEQELLKVRDPDERHPQLKTPSKEPYVPPQSPPPGELVMGDVKYQNRTLWYAADGECNYILTLSSNKVLKSHGGRISLDLHDKLSFEVRLRTKTSLGKIMMYRPLLVVTNTNPTVLRVDKTGVLQNNPQTLKVMLSPTGFNTGVAIVTVRNVVSSLKCRHSNSLTFIVLVHREQGRRLHVNYPILSCKPKSSEGRYARPWVVDAPGCIRRDEILDDQSEIHRLHGERRRIVYVTLPVNYRPPSVRGADIPLTGNVYNADPSKPNYKAWYKISRDTIKLIQCANKKTAEDCDCTDNDRLSDDEKFSECKRKVFYTHRTGSTKSVHIMLNYDRIMKNEDQHLDFFTPKQNWSVYIEEVNGRTEWLITNDQPYLYLDTINKNKRLNGGQTHYNMKSFNVTLMGTGLFHFKATLGKFESFGEVSGYFMLYANPNELNHIHLFLIMLVTILFCFTMVLIGFLAVRKRLSSQLPIQPMSQRKKLKLL